MNNTMNINGYHAIINYDSDLELFRGEFIHLNGGADFYADNIKGLRAEGELSLTTFLEVCKEKGISPKKQYSGKIQLRMPAELHEKLAEYAATHDGSINKVIIETLSEQIRE